MDPLIQYFQLFRRRTSLSQWTIDSQGSFYVFVKHPFKGIDATQVSRRLAEETGVVALPTKFFGPAKQARTPAEDDDMWIRFPVANVDDEKI